MDETPAVREVGYCTIRPRQDVAAGNSSSESPLGIPVFERTVTDPEIVDIPVGSLLEFIGKRCEHQPFDFYVDVSRETLEAWGDVGASVQPSSSGPFPSAVSEVQSEFATRWAEAQHEMEIRREVKNIQVCHRFLLDG